jgi:23S rRNA (guanosine2251-2'-O)-methyltransferase
MITIEGRNPVLESLRAKQLITDVFIKEGVLIDSKISEILELCKKSKIRYKFVDKKFLDKMSNFAIHQGIIAIRHETRQQSLLECLEDFEKRKQMPFVIYIREAQNEFNVGSIIRSAESAGANLVILPPKTHITPQMIRASMGASEHITVVNENLFSAIKTCQEWAMKVVGIELTGEKYYYQENLQGPMMLIIGGEDRSLSAEVTNKCDFVVKIPQLGKVNSLNMSIAASIVMFEKVKQDLN